MPLCLSIFYALFRILEVLISGDNVAREKEEAVYIHIFSRLIEQLEGIAIGSRDGFRNCLYSNQSYCIMIMFVVKMASLHNSLL